LIDWLKKILIKKENYIIEEKNVIFGEENKINLK
jgi:hypothetical protein